jgi:hypothetical protein
VAAVAARGARLRGLVVERDGRVAAAAIVRDGDRVEALQVVAPDEGTAADLLLAAAGQGRELRFRNVPGAAPASLAMHRLGAQLIATQHEMRVTL